jgi:chromosome segregation ATPase
MKPGSGKTKS